MTFKFQVNNYSKHTFMQCTFTGQSTVNKTSYNSIEPALAAKYQTTIGLQRYGIRSMCFLVLHNVAVGARQTLI